MWLFLLIYTGESLIDGLVKGQYATQFELIKSGISFLKLGSIFYMIAVNVDFFLCNGKNLFFYWAFIFLS